jgi:hypothetical protein
MVLSARSGRAFADGTGTNAAINPAAVREAGKAHGASVRAAKEARDGRGTPAITSVPDATCISAACGITSKMTGGQWEVKPRSGGTPLDVRVDRPVMHVPPQSSLARNTGAGCPEPQAPFGKGRATELPFQRRPALRRSVHATVVLSISVRVRGGRRRSMKRGAKPTAVREERKAHSAHARAA